MRVLIVSFYFSFGISLSLVWFELISCLVGLAHKKIIQGGCLKHFKCERLLLIIDSCYLFISGSFSTFDTHYLFIKRAYCRLFWQQHYFKCKNKWKQLTINFSNNLIYKDAFLVPCLLGCQNVFFKNVLWRLCKSTAYV